MALPHPIDHWFDHHPPASPGVIHSHELARSAFKELAHVVDDLLPDSAEKVLALRGLKSALAHVNEAIALGQVECAPGVAERAQQRCLDRFEAAHRA